MVVWCQYIIVKVQVKVRIRGGHGVDGAEMGTIIGFALRAGRIIVVHFRVAQA